MNKPQPYVPNLFKKAIPFLVLGLFVVMAALLPELLGEGVKTWCQTNLGPYWWAVIICIFLLLFGLAAKYKPDLLGGLLPTTPKDGTEPKREDITHFYPTIREYLQTRYANRLKQKLANRQPVNLRRLPSYIGSDEAIAAYVPYSSGEIQETMAKTFQEAHGRLLLVGAPGAGKTSLLLQLAQNILETEKDALPALLNLATWSKEYPTLEDWLKEILPMELGVNKALAQQIILDNRLILLFDGLDEVKEENRAFCLEAIGRYGMDAQRRFIISSRIEEYKAVMKDAPIYLQIEVGPLTIEQVGKELARMGHDQPEAVRLFHALQCDPLLRQAAQTPFYLNTLQLLFASGKTLADLRFQADTVKGRQQEIVERFVMENLARPGKQARTSEEAKKWLAYWASRMKQRNLVVFELKDLQYDWWRWNKFIIKLINMISELLLFPLIFPLTFLGIFIFFTYLIYWHSNLLKYSVFLSTIIMLLIFILFYISNVGSIVLSEIRTKEKLVWVPKLFYREFIGMGSAILIGGLLSNGLISMLEGEITVSLSGLMMIFAASLFFGFWSGTHILQMQSIKSIVAIKSPYKRFTTSIFPAFHFSILQHLHLRYLLYRRGLLPLRLVHFLNEMTERHLLESDGAEFDKGGHIVKSGATWRFRHRILQEYFAEQWKEEADSSI